VTRGIFTVWPANLDGKPGGSWHQSKRWLVLDVTSGIEDAIIIGGPIRRNEALRHELDVRTGSLTEATVREQLATREPCDNDNHDCSDKTHDTCHCPGWRIDEVDGDPSPPLKLGDLILTRCTMCTEHLPLYDDDLEALPEAVAALEAARARKVAP
jgi:hypothetical protein